MIWLCQRQLRLTANCQIELYINLICQRNSTLPCLAPLGCLLGVWHSQPLKRPPPELNSPYLADAFFYLWVFQGWCWQAVRMQSLTWPTKKMSLIGVTLESSVVVNFSLAAYSTSFAFDSFSYRHDNRKWIVGQRKKGSYCADEWFRRYIVNVQ